MSSDVQNPFLQYDKTWCKPLTHNAMVRCYLLGFKTKIVRQYNRGQLTQLSGLQLYVKTIEEHPKRFNFFIQHDPYFYVTFDYSNPEKLRQLSTLLKMNLRRSPENNNRIIASGLSNHRLDKTNGIKQVEIVQRYVFRKKGAQFIDFQPVLKISLHTPNDVPKYHTWLQEFAKESEEILDFDDEGKGVEGSSLIQGIYERDVVYSYRVGLDLKLRAGKAYLFSVKDGQVARARNGSLVYQQLTDIKEIPELSVFTFDLEAQVPPAQDVSKNDPINMLAVKFEDQGYLFNNTELTHFDLPDYIMGIDEHTVDDEGNALLRRMSLEESQQKWNRKPVSTKTINVKNEKDLILAFKALIQKTEPEYITGYNSDAFDWWLIRHRSRLYNIKWDDLFEFEKPYNRDKSNTEEKDPEIGVFHRDGCMMCDGFHWMTRDSYLSKGYRGLKSASKLLLHIDAMETEHAVLARQWVYMKNVLLNEDAPEHNNPESTWAMTILLFELTPEEITMYEQLDYTDRNIQVAQDRVFTFAQYNMSDVVITDIFTRETILPFNIALAGLTPLTVDQVSSEARGKQCELKLMDRMNGWGIAPNKFIGFIQDQINPTDARRYGRVYMMYDKTIDASQKETMTAECKTWREMIEHCKGCSDEKCKTKWMQNWKLDLTKQIRIKCKRDSPPDEPEDEVCFFPLINTDLPVESEGFQGARVSCFNPGLYHQNAKLKFEIDKPFVEKMFQDCEKALDKLLDSFERKSWKKKNGKLIKRYTREGVELGCKIQNKDEIKRLFKEKLIKTLTELQPDPKGRKDIYIWIGNQLLLHIDVASMYPSVIINWNLNPYAVVDPEKDCATCPYHWQKCGDPVECWIKLPWIAQYEVLQIPPTVKAEVDHKLEKFTTVKRERRLEMYKKALDQVKGKRRSYLNYQFPGIATYCQKAHRFFADAVRNFREERLKYKNGMKDADDEIDSIKDEFEGHALPTEVQMQINRLQAISTYNRNTQLGFKVLLNSVHADEWILIRSPNGQIKYWRIEEFHTFLISKGFNMDFEDQRNGVMSTWYQIWNGDAFVPLVGIIKHQAKENLFKITTTSGRSIRITPGHSLMVLDDHLNLVAKKGDAIQLGEYVIIPTGGPRYDRRALNTIPNTERIGNDIFYGTPTEQLTHITQYWHTDHFEAPSEEIMHGIGFILQQIGVSDFYYDCDTTIPPFCIYINDPTFDLGYTSNRRISYVDILPNSIIRCVPELHEYHCEEWVNITTIYPLLEHGISDEAHRLQEYLDRGYRFDIIAAIASIPSSPHVYDASVDFRVDAFVCNGILSHNTYYGYLGGPGARFKSYEVTGSTCAMGQEIIGVAVDYYSHFGINQELDSLDYHERLILRNPNGLIQVMKIGEFTDFCFATYGTTELNPDKNVEYSIPPPGWSALSVNKDGRSEWQPIKRAIRQRTDRDLKKIITPMGTVKVTESHSVFATNNAEINPIEVKSITDEYLTHICEIPPVEINAPVHLAITNKDIPLYAFIPKECGKLDYPIANLRLTPYSTIRKKYYKVPIELYHGEFINQVLIGSAKSFKFPARIPLDEDLAELCGWYVAEGWSSFRKRGNKNDVGSYIAQQKPDNLDRIFTLVQNIGKYINNFEAKKILSDAESNTYRVEMNNVFFYHLFSILGCGRTSFEKRIPDLILSAPRAIKEAFLRGYFGGDGSYQGNRKAFCTVSDGLRDDLFVLGKQLGYVVTNYTGKSSSSDSIVYTINFTDKESWRLGIRGHYKFTEYGKTVGIAAKSIENIENSSPYVYDLSIETNNNFVSANGGMLLHNTDGLWCCLPAFVPLKVDFKYEVLNLTAQTPLIDDGHAMILKGDVNVFAEVINDLVAQKFTNNSNYIPCAADGKVYNNMGTLWDSKSDQELFDNQPFDYERDDDWIADRHWIPKPQCYIEYDAEGPYLAEYIERKKMMKVWIMDKNTGMPVTSVVTGMTEKRKDGFKMNKEFSIAATNIMPKAGSESIENGWKAACDIANTYIDHINAKDMNIKAIVETKDLSESAEDVRKSYTRIKETFAAEGINPEEFHIYESFIRAKYQNNPEKIVQWLGSSQKSEDSEDSDNDDAENDNDGIIGVVKSSKYLMAALRMLDMGMAINTVSYFVSKYPQWEGTKRVRNPVTKRITIEKYTIKEKISQRVIPMSLFDAPPDQIRKYLKRWFGINATSVDIKDYIDWDAYKDSLVSSIERTLIHPASRQKINTYKWLKLDDPHAKKAPENNILTNLMNKKPTGAGIPAKPVSRTVTSTKPIIPASKNDTDVVAQVNSPKKSVGPMDKLLQKNPLKLIAGTKNKEKKN